MATIPRSVVAIASSKLHHFIGQCCYCKEENHRISDCAMKKAKDTRNAQKAKAHTSLINIVTVFTNSSFLESSSTPTLSSFTTANFEAIVHQVLSRTPIALTFSSSISSSWFLDSACCNRMTLDSSLLFEKKTVNMSLIFTLVIVPICLVLILVRSLPLLFQFLIHISFQNSLNLFFIGQLVEHGLVLTFSNKGCDVQN